MGMYDYVKCDMELPGGGIVPDEMQTKSMDCLMAVYRIAADGQLYLDDPGWHVDADDKPEPTPYNLTGEIVFYPGRKPDGKWVDYSAYFVDGKIREFHRLERD